MYKITLYIVIHFACLPLFSQTEALRWYFGEYAGIHFMDSEPKSLSDSKMYAFEGCAVICDKVNGDLLFYTNGTTVWNKNHHVMKNGNGLNGGSSSTQSSLIVPNPQNEYEYYIFTTPSRTDSATPPELYYSIVSLSGPEGEVVIKNVFLFDQIGEKITGVRDCNTDGYWIITHHIKSPRFFAIHLSVYGLNTKPVVSDFNGSYSGSYAGYLKASPNGKKIATAMGVFNNPNILCLFDFDNVTGRVSNRRVIDKAIYIKHDSATENPTQWFYGVSFSPDNTKLYATSGLGILQYDVTKESAFGIRESREIISSKFVTGALQIAPDNKIYLSPFTGGEGRLCVIGKPNEKGVLSDYSENGPKAKYRYGLPNFMDYIFADDYSPFTLCLKHYGKLDTVYTCAGVPVTITHHSSKMAAMRRWDIENSVIEVKNDSTIQCTINDKGVYKVRLIYKYKAFLDTMYSAVIVGLPKGSAGKDAYYCKDTTVYYHRLGSKPIKGYKYAWTPTDGLSNPSIANPMLRVTKTQQYIVTATDSSGCSSSDTVEINLNKTIVPKVIGSTTVCAGSSTKLLVTGGTSYRWYPGTGLSDSTIADPIVTLTETTHYRILIAIGNCSTTMNLTVYVRDSPKVSATSTITCAGQEIQLFTSGGKQYRWVPGHSLNDSTIANPIASPRVTTEYKVYAIMENCIDSASITISVKPSPIADAGEDRAICKGTSTRLGTRHIDGNSYSWNPKSFLDSSTIAEPLLKADKNMKYILTVRNSDGCVAYDTVTIKVDNSLTIHSKQSTRICLGDSLQLEAKGAEIYTWFPTNSLNNANIETPIAKPLSTTMYYVTGTAGECLYKDSILVTVTIPPKMSVKPIEPICKGSGTILQAAGAEKYLWFPSDRLHNANSDTPFARPLITTMYYVKGYSGNCESLDSVLVIVKEKPEIKLSGGNSVCKGDSIQLRAIGAENYTWSPKEFVSNTFEAETYVYPDKTTLFKVIGEKNGCYTEDSILVNVIEPLSLTLTSDTSICLGDSVQLFADGADTYRWSPATGLNNPLSPTPIANPTSTVKYTVYGTRSGCTDSKDIVIEVRNQKQYELRTSLGEQNVFSAGSVIPINIEIPSGVSKISFSLQYDACCFFYTGKLMQRNACTVYVDERKGELKIMIDSVRKIGEKIILEFILLLPNDGRLSEIISIHNVKVYQDCAVAKADKEINIIYHPTCAWNIRGVKGAGKFDIEMEGEKAILYTGLGGKTSISIYDMTGQKVWGSENNYPQSTEAEILLPELNSGVYILRAQNYVWKKDMVMVK